MRTKVALANPNYDSSKIAEFKNVWVFCEQRLGKLMPTDFELLSEGRKLAEELGTELCGLLLGKDVAPLAKELAGYGADKIILCENDLLEFYTTMFTEVEDVITDLSVEIPAWNFLCPLGSFGIFEEEGHLYHKYGLPFSGDTETEKFAKDSVAVMKFLFDIIADKYAAVLEMMIEGE